MAVAVASPAKLQAAAALAEVANGIEGEVSGSRTTPCHVILRGSPCVKRVVFVVETSPSAHPGEARCEEGEPVV